jgi:hypothetical protein
VPTARDVSDADESDGEGDTPPAGQGPDADASDGESDSDPDAESTDGDDSDADKPGSKLVAAATPERPPADGDRAAADMAVHC